MKFFLLELTVKIISQNGCMFVKIKLKCGNTYHFVILSIPKVNGIAAIIGEEPLP
jgi:hypothetical protein